VIDGLDLDHEFGLPEPDFYEEQGGDYAPIILCSFDKNYIADLECKLNEAFASDLSVSHAEMKTESWQNGWKDQFQPIVTEHFRVLPTWETNLYDDNKIPVYIEPGMAFGTGQHASTQLCLRLLDRLVEQRYDFSKASTLDVGTGSGILAITVAKLGHKPISASDIDKDALIAARENARINSVSLDIYEGSLPPENTYDLILANILYKVLAPMLPDLSMALNPGGLLILSGLIEDQCEDMLTLARRQGLTLLAVERQEAWLALLFQSGAGEFQFNTSAPDSESMSQTAKKRMILDIRV
jgi:ribosomal protein L11 methyltransferase